MEIKVVHKFIYSMCKDPELPKEAYNVNVIYDYVRRAYFTTYDIKEYVFPELKAEFMEPEADYDIAISELTNYYKGAI